MPGVLGPYSTDFPTPSNAAPPGVLSPNYTNTPQTSWITPLHPLEQAMFMDWVRKNNVPYDPSPQADYDMPGFWKGLMAGDPRAHSGVNPNDNRLHFTDAWKTPYHQTFSNQSIYSKNQTDPQWQARPPTQHGWNLMQFGKPIFQE